MELGWITPTVEQSPQTSHEQSSVRMELLPAWKQLIMESRQAQTETALLIVRLKRQRAAVAMQVEVSRQQRFVLIDRFPSLLS